MGKTELNLLHGSNPDRPCGPMGSPVNPARLSISQGRLANGDGRSRLRLNKAAEVLGMRAVFLNQENAAR